MGADHIFWCPPVTQPPQQRDGALNAYRMGRHVQFHAHATDDPCEGFATLGKDEEGQTIYPSNVCWEAKPWLSAVSDA